MHCLVISKALRRSEGTDPIIKICVMHCRCRCQHRRKCSADLQVGGNWIELPAGKYVYHPLGDGQKQSHCQMEAHVHYRQTIHPHCVTKYIKLRLRQPHVRAPASQPNPSPLYWDTGS